MRETIKQEQSDLTYGDRINSLMDLYSNGLKYVSALMNGLSQMSLFLLANYAQPRSFALPYSQNNGLIKLAIRPSDGRAANGETALNNREGIFSSVKQRIEGSFVKNAPSALRTTLEFMCLAYSSNYELRKHIRNIHAKYHFSFRDYDTEIFLEFNKGVMRVFPGNIELPDVSFKFNNSDAFRKLFFSTNPDILEMILKQDVVMDGNLTYMYKFMYLVRHLQMKLMGPV
jgi:hypothetical protein